MVVHAVSVRPFARWAAMISCGPWQTAAINFPAASKAFTDSITRGSSPKSDARTPGCSARPSAPKVIGRLPARDQQGVIVVHL